MALTKAYKVETDAIAHGSLTTSSTHAIGTAPAHSVVIACGATCTEAATIGGANAVEFGTAGDADLICTGDINAAKTLNATTVSTNTNAQYFDTATVINAKTAGSNAPSAGAFKFWMIVQPLSATRAAAEADRNKLD